MIEQLDAMIAQTVVDLQRAVAEKQYEGSGALRGLLDYLRDAQRVAVIVATLAQEVTAA